MRNPTETNNSIKKLCLQETVLFAINSIPQIDTLTLKRFLELVNAGGTFGSITHEQILRTMRLVIKYVPDASVSSLLVVLDLLDIKTPNPLATSTRRESAGRDEAASIIFFTGIRQTMAVE